MATILFVSNNEHKSDVLNRICKLAKHTVLRTPSGGGCLDALEDTADVSLIIVDVPAREPGYTEALNCITSCKGKEVPVLALCDGDPCIMRAVTAAGAMDYQLGLLSRDLALGTIEYCLKRSPSYSAPV